MLNRVLNSVANRLRSYLEGMNDRTLKSKLKFCGSSVSIEHPVSFQGLEQISIDDDVSIAAFVHVWGNGGLTIGKRVMIASNTSITTITHDHGRADMYKTIVAAPVVIEDDVWIGANSVIMPGVRLKKGCVIGAGSVVTKDVESMTIVAGVPARLLKTREICS